MIKKLTFVCLALLAAVMASAADFTVNGLNYREWSLNTVIIMPKGEDAYYSGLTSNNFSSTVTYNGKTYTVEGIADNAFAKAKWSGTITLPSTITTIGSFAFDAAEGAGLSIGPNVEYLLEGAFAGNKLTTGFTVDANNPYYANLTDSDGSGSNGILVTKDKKTLVSYPGGKGSSSWWSSPSYTIANCITEVGDYAFYMNAKLGSVTIPNTVTRIGKAAFYECTNFSRITIPASVKEFGTSAFCGCVNVTSLTFNSPCQFTEIPGHAFFYLISLKSVTLPEGVKRLGLMSFASCEALTTINLSSTVELLDSTCFLDDPITKIDLKNVKTIGHMAFSGCSELTQITGGNNLQEIRTSAFANCSKLTTVTIPESLKILYRNAFFRCTGLTTLNLPSTLEYMTGNPAVGCTKLQTINISENCPHFKVIDGAVYATTGATDLEETPNADGDHNQPTVLVGVPAALSNKVLNVPEGVYALGYQACREVKLTEMNLPKTMKEFRSSAVGTIGTLTKITCLAKNPPTIASTFAAADYTNAVVTVPTVSLADYQAAQYWSQFQHWATVDVEFDEDPEVYILGEVNGNNWATNVGAKMNTEDNETFTLDVTVNGTYGGYGFFGFTTKLAETADDWDGIDEYRFGAVSEGDFYVLPGMEGQEISLTFDDYHALRLPAGEYTFTVNLKTMKLVITGDIVEPIDDVYVMGEVNGNSWAANVGVKMDTEDGKIYTATVTADGVSGGYNYFSFTTRLGEYDMDWEAILPYRFGAVSEGDFWITEDLIGQPITLDIDGQGESLRIDQGTWNLVVDRENRTLVVTKKGGLRGDLNGDGLVDVTDVSMLIDIVLGKTVELAEGAEPNLNGDDNIDVSDVSILIDIVLGKEQ